MTESSLHPPVRVLHVEDDYAVRAGVTVLLRTLGYVVEAVASGKEALAWLDRRMADPDVLIMDVDLPGELQGGDVAQEIFRSLGHALPTIVLSGKLTEMLLPWMPGFPILCLWKPADADILMKAVETFATFGRFAHARLSSHQVHSAFANN